MRFANPIFLWGLLAIPALGAFLWWSAKQRRLALERFASPAAIPHLAGTLTGMRKLAKPLLLLAGCAGVVVAAARPQWGYEDRHIISKGVDLIIAVDTSKSMLAEDYKPNRLARAKELLQDLLWRAKGDRVGILAFAGDTFMQCPLTLDHGMARAALEGLSVDSVPVQGTAIGNAIAFSMKAFNMYSTGERVLVLLTDGEDSGTDPIEEAQKAAKEGVKIYTIGIGTSQGMPIPENGGYKQDKQGRTVNSRLDFQTLAKIAQFANGKAIKANPRGSSEADEIMSDLEGLQKSEQQDKIFRVYTERYQWFLLPAILLLIIEALDTGFSRSGRAWKGRVTEA